MSCFVLVYVRKPKIVKTNKLPICVGTQGETEKDSQGSDSNSAYGTKGSKGRA